MAAPKGSLRQKIAEQTKAGRLRLHHWLRERYAELAEARAELKPTWEQFAKSVAAVGARDAKGNLPTGPAVRKVWIGLEAEMRQQSSRTSPLVPPPVRPVPPAVTLPPTSEGTADERRSSLRGRWNPTATDEDYERLTGRPKPK
jgi:hypothetical protein